MERGAGWNRRCAIVLFLACLLISGQSTALLSTGEPHHATEHCCLLCHVGALPFLQAVNVATVEPPIVLERLMADPNFEASPDVLPSANCSRAPPA